MAIFELTHAADHDLTKIYSYTFREFGERQADDYLASLDRCFARLADQPALARTADGVRPGYRRFEHGSHVIFFSAIAGGIRIVRVLHGRMDPKRHL